MMAQADKELIKHYFFPLDVDYILDGEDVVVRLFGVTPEHKRILVTDRTFLPYFYVTPNKGANSNYLIQKLR